MAKVIGESPAGTIDGANAGFTLTRTPAPSTALKLWLNGLRLTAGVHFDLAGATITYRARFIPQPGDTHVADYPY